MRSLHLLLVFAVIVISAGCSGKASDPDPVSGGDVVVSGGLPTGTSVVGAEGGVVMSASGAGVRIPVGALASDTLIAVAAAEETPIPEMHPLTPIYAFSPVDVALSRPVTLILPLPGDMDSAFVFLMRLDGSGWDLIGGAVWGGSIKAQATHLGKAFAAGGSGPGGLGLCPGPAPGFLGGGVRFCGNRKRTAWNRMPDGE